MLQYAQTLPAIMRRLFQYLNPIAHLGHRNYSVLFPLLSTFFLAVFIDILVYRILADPSSAGLFAIALPLAFIIYFSFRDGITGGVISSVITILFYVYIVDVHPTPNQTEEQLTTQFITITALGTLYIFIALTIGWLKQTIDKLILQEADEKRRLQAILEQLPVGVLITNSRGQIIQGNKQVEVILGRKMNSELVVGKDTIPNAEKNHRSNSHISDKAVQASDWPLARALKTKKAVVGKEFIITHENGKKVHLQISASPIRSADGRVIAAASIIYDVTAQKELEARKDDFVNMASHELKTPITSLKLYMASLKSRFRKHQDEGIRKILKSIDYQMDKLQGLVSDLLDVSRIQTGKLMLNYEDFRLDNLVSETAESLQGTIKNHQIIIRKKSPVKVHADRFRIYQVLTNLITNAAKYSSDNKDIAIELRKDGNKVVVSVIDNGIGIDKDKQKKIFEKLYQVTDSKERTFPGLGMGLFISKEIISRHKGQIWVESEKGKGSIFSFSLPLPS